MGVFLFLMHPFKPLRICTWMLSSLFYTNLSSPQKCYNPKYLAWNIWEVTSILQKYFVCMNFLTFHRQYYFESNWERKRMLCVLWH